ncbi:MAG: TPR end-of-group domain-containing protein, partial [Gemmataceae bacterium]
MAHLNAGRPTDALRDFQAALKQNPASVDARMNIAVVFGDHLQRIPEAISTLTELLEEFPEYRAARGGRAVFTARLGRRDAAHKDAEQLLTDRPTAFERYQMAGVYALTSKAEPKDRLRAIQLLAEALSEQVGLEYVDTDADLDPLRKDPQFQKCVLATKALTEGKRPKRHN